MVFKYCLSFLLKGRASSCGRIFFVGRGISQMFCFCSWLLWMFINLNRKKREKSKKTNPASLQSSVIFSFLNEKLTFWWLCVCVKHEIQPCLNSEVSLRKCTCVWNIVWYFCFRRHLFTAPSNYFQSHCSKSLQRDMRKHLFFYVET